VSESKCNAASKPPVRIPCELYTDNLVVSFDEENLWDVGGMMDNVVFYDQFDWYLWNGYPPNLNPTGISFQGAISKGPGQDTSGAGRYLLFHTFPPVQPGDQAWYESPVIETKQATPCSVSFSWWVAGGDASISVELASCSNCKQRKVLWTGRKKLTIMAV